MPFGIQPIHIVIIILVAFLIFGANKLPELGRSLGKTITEFRKGTREAAEGFKEEIQKNPPAPAGPVVTALPIRQPQLPRPPQPPPHRLPSRRLPGRCSLPEISASQCGNPNPPEAHFCASCGAKLPEKVA